MMRFLSFILCFSLFIGCFSCQIIANYQIVGVWKISQIFENSKIQKDETLDEILLQFTDEGRYTFNSTLNYRETGNFKVNQNILWMTDESSKEKGIHIESLTSEKMILLMKEQGKLRKMIFQKVN